MFNENLFAEMSCVKTGSRTHMKWKGGGEH
jgi:hypothetical protein